MDGQRNGANDSPDAAGGLNLSELNRPDDIAMVPSECPESRDVEERSGSDGSEVERDDPNMRPFPFYSYRDYSKESDPDNLSPLTPPGRVPNFPAKMHAILSRADFSDIVCWMPHGRAWKILKPREFELRVIPLYFEHAKFSSFIRQANGWDFRRLTKGLDRNCYYNPYFLRGLPHLCKHLKRPGVSMKVTSDPDHEPNMYQISELHPVPTHYTDDSVLLHCILQEGPKARMPVFTGLSNPHAAKLEDFRCPGEALKKPAADCVSELTPRDKEVINGFQSSLASSEKDFRTFPQSASASLLPLTTFIPPSVLAPQSCPPVFHFLPRTGTAATLAAANNLAFPSFLGSMLQGQTQSHSSQFAAGFLAATALSEQNFANMLSTLSASINNQLPPGSASNNFYPQVQSTAPTSKTT